MAEKNDSQVREPMPEEDKREMQHRTRLVPWMATALVLILFLVLLLVALWEPAPAVDCTMVDRDLELDTIPERNLSRKFVDGEIIITGHARQVQDLAASLDLEPIRSCRLNYLRKLSKQENVREAFLPFSQEALEELTTNLYRVPPEGLSMEQIIEKLNEEGGKSLVAEANWLLGSPPSLCGSPHSDAGSPFGGPPKLLPVGEEMAVKWFWEQWAFNQTGVGPSFKDEAAGAAILHQGEGTLVGVFDTSPFRDPWAGVENPRRGAVQETQETVKWVNPAMDVEPLTLRVSYPVMVSNRVISGTPEATGPLSPDMRDHGIFVAGLIHAVAPASEVRLIRVLNEYGCGPVYTLYEAVLRFIGDAAQERGTLEGVVINLSLGYDDPEWEIGADPCEVVSPTHGMTLLCTTLRYAEQQGARIVAAAGNGSYDKSEHQRAQFPALYQFVTGASASTQEGQLACFSNIGDIAAPGGEGNTTEPGLCESAVKECDEGDCKWGVIGPVVFPPEGHAYWSTHYAYWSGSSFAAPLVSGLFALGAERPWFAVPADEVESAGITCTSTDPELPGGIVHLPHALLGMDCPAP